MASMSVGRNPSPTSCQLAMALLCFMQVLPMRYPIYKVHVEAGCDGKPFEGTLVGITPASTLVTPFGTITFLKTMSISPHNPLLGRGLHEETWQATDDSDIKFLNRREM